jgi:hypothetical protein
MICHRDTEPWRSSLTRIATESRSHGDHADEDGHRATEIKPEEDRHRVAEPRRSL